MDEIADDKAGKRNKTGRSPAYPFISISKALEQTRALHKQEGEYLAPLSSAFDAWGYGLKSSGGRQTMAALKYYGLIDIVGEGDARKVKISDAARRILLDSREDETEKKALIRKVAMNPTAHQAIFNEYPRGLASDGSVIHFLTFGLGFKGDAPKDLLAEFKETASVIGLYQPENLVDKEAAGAQSGGDKTPPPEVVVGSKIQWNSQGVDQFPGGGTVLAVSDDGQWVFTDQGASAVQISEVIIVEQTAPLAGQTPPPAPAHVLATLAAAGAATVGETKLAPDTLEEKFNTDEGVVIIRFPEKLSPASVTDLADFFDLFIKKAKRRAGVQ
jgi:hypothetical protein